MGKTKKRVVKGAQRYVGEVKALLQQNCALTVEEACNILEKKYGVSKSALKVAYYRYRLKPDAALKELGQTKLTKQERDAFVGSLKAFSQCGSPLTKAAAIAVLRKLMSKGDSWNGWPMLKRILSSYRKDVHVRKGKVLTKKRTALGMLEEVKQFINAVEHGPNYPKHAQLNCDEMILWCKNESGQVIVCSSLEKPNFIGRQHQCVGTYLPFVAADGTVLCSFYILKQTSASGCAMLDLTDENALFGNSRSRSSWPRYFAATETGYINKATWRNILSKVVELWTSKYPGLNCRIYMDNLSSHCCPIAVGQAFHKGVHCWFLPKNTSHFLQPLDNLCFAQMRRILNRLVAEERLKSAIWAVDGHSFMQLVFTAEQEAMSRRVVLKSFEQTAIMPFNKKVMLEHTIKNQHMLQIHVPQSSTATSSSIMERMLDVTKAFIQQNRPASPSPVRKLLLPTDAVFSAFDIVKKQQQQRMEEHAKEQSKIEAAKARAEELQQRNEAREAKKRKREEDKKALETRKKQKTVEKEKKKKELEQQKASRRCRKCHSHWRINSRDWVGCEGCDTFWICYSCYFLQGRSGKTFLARHEKRCQNDEF